MKTGVTFPPQPLSPLIIIKQRNQVGRGRYDLLVARCFSIKPSVRRVGSLEQLAAVRGQVGQESPECQ